MTSGPSPSVSVVDWMCPDCSRVVESKLVIFATPPNRYRATLLKCSCGRVINPLSIHPRYIVKIEEEGAKFLLPEKADYLRSRSRILRRIT